MSGYQVVYNNALYSVISGGIGTISDAATCPAGKVAIGGGGHGEVGGQVIDVLAGYPDALNPDELKGNATWKVVFGPARGAILFESDRNVTYRVYVTCVNAN